ncbi:hypothetical protein KOR34_41870 [Posidoniimonas corsicana]|uniref:PEP-CTERM protein-sorting domain-containing protein n=1 Tax=Posidoniimonas corsicana TaxID=1938618 RepID=A0A5C5V1E0_9BACT|nr:type VI secretion system tube protein Hcp [Posidoniimonas corsicana]TWT32424.1 hypothetical protein KOR34_41870 [Posidoniimonas corsicana]
MRRLRLPTRLLLGFLAPLFCHAAAEGQIAMRLVDQPVAGDFDVPGWKDWLTLHSVGASITRDPPEGGKGGTEDINIGVGELEGLSLTKPTGAGSATLFQHALNGNSLGDVLVFYLTQGEKGLEPMAAWKLDRAFVFDYSTQSSAAGLNDAFTLAFNKIAFGVANDSGGYDFASWDLTKNTPWTDHGLAGDLNAAPKSLSLAGDFNFDGAVDAADYTVWRDGLGAPYPLSAYDDWRDNYGAAASAATPATAPEPAAAALAAVLFLAGLGGVAARAAPCLSGSRPKRT